VPNTGATSYLTELKEALREVLDDPQQHEALKGIFKSALTEWLDTKWAEVGKWSVRGISAAAVVGIFYLFAKAKGLL
jgi:hypothetical protein